MGDRTDPENGLVIFDQRLVDATYLADNDGTATNSDYSESTPRPGRVTKVEGQSLVPTITNAQAATIGLRVQRSGYSGVGGLSYTLDSGTTKRGWQPPKFLGATGVNYDPTTGTGQNPSASVTIPSTQTIVTVYGSRTNAIPIRARTFDGSDWSAASQVTDQSAYALALWVTRDESRIVMARIGSNLGLSTWYSLDSGASWTRQASQSDVGITTTTTDHVSAGWIGDDMILITDSGQQYASSDTGITWTLVTTDATIDSGQVVSTSDGTALVVYVESGNSDVEYIRMASAYTKMSSAGGSAIKVGTFSGLCAGEDANGTIHVYAYDGTGYWFTSDDGGENWTENGVVWVGGSLHHFYASRSTMVAHNGSMTIIGPSNVNTQTTDDSILAYRFSEWSTIEWDGPVTYSWYGLMLPNTCAAVLTGTAGTIASPGKMQLSTTAATGYYTWTGAGTSTTPGILTRVAVPTGGTYTANNIVIRLTSCDGSDTYLMALRLATTGFRVIDFHGGSATVATETVDMTTGIEIFACMSSKGVPYVAHRNEFDVVWTVVDLTGYGSLTSSGAGSANWIGEIGHVIAVTEASEWHFASLFDDIGTVRTGTSLDGQRITSAPYPLPDTADSDSKIAMVSIRGGLGLDTETYTIDPSHRYPVENCLPALSPSPYRQWRSTDLTEQIIAFDFAERSNMGAAFALLLAQVNFRTAYLEYYDGAVWQTAGTYDGATGLTGISYDLVGNSIRSTSGGASGGRVIQEMEFADGGYAILTKATGNLCRYISSNDGGRWEPTGSTTTVEATANLEGIDGTEDATNTVSLVADGGLLIVYPTATQVRRRWRLRIPAQVSPDTYFKIGVLGIGRFIPFGQGFGWGMVSSEEGEYESFRDSAGTESRTRLGAQIREWSFDFSDGVLGYNHRSVQDADYVGISGGLPLELEGGVWSQLRGILERTEGQTIPVVAVSQAPTSTDTITDKTRYLYGYLDGSISMSHGGGEIGTDELVRIETLRVKGVSG